MRSFERMRRNLLLPSRQIVSQNFQKFMWKILTSLITIILLLILTWCLLGGTIIRGLNPIVNIIFIAFGVILLGYTLLIISRIEKRKIKLWLLLILVAGMLTIYVFEKYFSASRQGMPQRYFDVQSS